MSKSIFIFLLLIFFLLMSGCGVNNTSGNDDNTNGNNNDNGIVENKAIINYDSSSLFIGNQIIFDGSQSKDVVKYEWSYKRNTDSDFITAGLNTNTISMVFIKSGNYSVKLKISDQYSIIKDIEIKDRIIDINNQDVGNSTGLIKFNKSGNDYVLSIKLNDIINGIIKNEEYSSYVYFNIRFSDIYGNFLSNLGSYSNSKGDPPTVSPELDSLNGVQASNFPNVFYYRYLNKDNIKKIERIEHLVMFLTTGLNTETFGSKGPFILVTPDILPDEFYIFY